MCEVDVGSGLRQQRLSCHSMARTYTQMGCVDIDICGQLERVVWVVAMIWAFIADDQSIPSSSWTNILLHRTDCVSITRATDCLS